MRRISFFFSLILITLLTGQYAEGKWKKLAGKDLNAWTQINGTATFILEKGIVTGTTVLNSPNSFLCTKEKYGDFILEFDTWIDPQLNSGVQFRSEAWLNIRMEGFMDTRLKLILQKEPGQEVFTMKHGVDGCTRWTIILREEKLSGPVNGTITGWKLSGIQSGHG